MWGKAGRHENEIHFILYTVFPFKLVWLERKVCACEPSFALP